MRGKFMPTLWKSSFALLRDSLSAGTSSVALPFFQFARGLTSAPFQPFRARTNISLSCPSTLLARAPFLCTLRPNSFLYISRFIMLLTPSIFAGRSAQLCSSTRSIAFFRIVLVQQKIASLKLKFNPHPLPPSRRYFAKRLAVGKL